MEPLSAVFAFELNRKSVGARGIRESGTHDREALKFIIVLHTWPILQWNIIRRKRSLDLTRRNALQRNPQVYIRAHGSDRRQSTTQGTKGLTAGQ